MFAKNITNGPKGLNTKAGVVELASGQTSEDVELDDAELKSMKATGWFDFDGEAEDSSKLDRDDLKKQADELGLEYPKNISTAKLSEMIDAKLAE